MLVLFNRAALPVAVVDADFVSLQAGTLKALLTPLPPPDRDLLNTIDGHVQRIGDDFFVLTVLVGLLPHHLLYHAVHTLSSVVTVSRRLVTTVQLQPVRQVHRYPQKAFHIDTLDRVLEANRQTVAQGAEPGYVILCIAARPHRQNRNCRHGSFGGGRLNRHERQTAWRRPPVGKQTRTAPAIGPACPRPSAQPS